MTDRAREVADLIVVAVILWVLVLTGCSGRAVVHMIPLGAKKISMTSPLVVRVSPDECYFWLNEKQDLCVAMRATNVSLIGKRFEREFVLSLVLDGPPAGSARQYRVGRRVMRARGRAGYSHTRSASLAGIVGVWDYGKGKLRGRFRLAAKQQSYSVLTGWKGDRRVLFVGEFIAAANREMGERILVRTEEDGMARPPPRGKPIPVKGPPGSLQQNEPRA
ncbi:MAG: hypothetical protein WBE26_19775 [Phycisphaerae bacterium]